MIQFDSPNYWAVDDLPVSEVKAICLHGTDGSFKGAMSWLLNPKSGVSASYIISKGGLPVMLVNPAKRRAWANGIVSQPDPTIKWLDDAIKNKVNPNWVTISIEHEATHDDMVYHRSMTDAQFNASIDLVASLLKQFNLKASHETIIGHCQINSKDKANCPGVIFIPAYMEVLITRYPELRP